jgi:hypothetical protein
MYFAQEVLVMMPGNASYAIEERVNPAFIQINEVKRLQGNAEKMRKEYVILSRFLYGKHTGWMYAGDSI